MCPGGHARHQRRRDYLACVALLAAAACDPPVALDRAELESGLVLPPTFESLGPADPGAQLRALIALPIRDEAALDASITAMYEPNSATFRQYLTADAWNDRHAPLAADVDAIVAWLEAGGLVVPRVAKNRLLLQVTGDVAAFEATFQTELELYGKIEDKDFHTFGTEARLWAPRAIAPRIAAVVTADLAADTTPLPGESGGIVDDPPPDTQRHTLARIARAYGAEPLYTAGRTGQGVTIGVVVGAGFKFFDVQSFWQAQGITREDPVVVTTMEPLSTRYTETTLDVEWAGGIAPGADLLVFAGPDAHETSLVYTFNAAIADGRAHVITDSFAHREDATPSAIRRQYHASAKMAAATGITVIAAGGDSGAPDVPSSSPLVTSVGGTVLEVDGTNTRTNETAWSRSGSGESLLFDAPAWQHAASPKRAVSDVALAAAGVGYWTYIFGEWRAHAGTSFSAPVFAGLVAVINSARMAKGKPRVGFLNSTLYRNAAVQATFHDVVSGATADFAAGVGWDYPTGWGAPNAAALEGALP